MTALAAVEMKGRRHDEKAGPWIEVSEFSAPARGIVGVHDLRVVRLLGCEALGVGDERHCTSGLGCHSRNPRGKGSSGASMCCEVPVIQARPVMVGTMAGWGIDDWGIGTKRGEKLPDTRLPTNQQTSSVFTRCTLGVKSGVNPMSSSKTLNSSI